MNSFNQDVFLKAWYYASLAHQSQKMPGNDKPYFTHIGTVVMEIMAISYSINNIDLAITCAILHDSIEDTNVTYDDLCFSFSKEVADSVLSLTKDETIATKKEQMLDSLRRIKEQSKSVWAVKLADRISNLETPPNYWKKDKIKAYWKESKLILSYLKDANKPLAKRLEERINRYESYL